MKHIVVVLAAVAILTAQDKTGSVITSYPGSVEQNLKEKWQWAIDSGEKQTEPYWIGYSFRRLMHENSFFGSCHDDDDRNSSLKDAIEAGGQAANQNLNDGYGHTTISDSGEKTLKSLAILFYMDDNQIKKMRINNLTLPFDLNSKDLYWMKSADLEQSLSHLINIFESNDHEKIAEQCIVAIGLHQNEKAFTFLKGVIHDEKNPELRETAIFWLSESGFKGTFEVLNWVIDNDPSVDVREHAIFGYYLINSNKGDEALIKHAREAKDMEIRKKAIFWLGQRASQKAIETLESTVFEEEETELQAQAVFALSQLEESKGLPILIKAAKEHPNPQVRKKAIFWLGQIEDDRALDVLVDIIQN